MNELPSWMSTSAAILTPTIAVAALVLAVCNYLLAARRRQDELFDRRYEFYQRVRSMWLATGNGAPEGVRPWLDTTELIPIAEEAGFLFGRDVSKHITSLADKQHSGCPTFPNDDFVAPFEKYLSLGR